MRIIVNADDLGFSSYVNERIFTLMEGGYVTSATMMMNAPAVEDAVLRIGQYPRASFGIHLNITEFAPLTFNPDIQPLLDEQGLFSHLPFRIPTTGKLRNAIFNEWCSQIEMALKLGISVSHIDSHNHIHNEPALFFVLKQVQRKFGIRKVRQTWNIYNVLDSPRPTLRLAKMFWSLMIRHYYRTKTTDGFTSFATFHELLRTGFTCHGDIELMCHPGNSLFEKENIFLDTSWQRDLIPQAQMISYNDL